MKIEYIREWWYAETLEYIIIRECFTMIANCHSYTDSYLALWNWPSDMLWPCSHTRVILNRYRIDSEKSCCWNESNIACWMVRARLNALYIIDLEMMIFGCRPRLIFMWLRTQLCYPRYDRESEQSPMHFCVSLASSSSHLFPMYQFSKLVLFSGSCVWPRRCVRTRSPHSGCCLSSETFCKGRQTYPARY